MSYEHKPEIKELLSFDDRCLAPGVFFVEGKKRCALYDTNSENVYSLDKTARDVLMSKTDNLSFWNKLSEMGLTTNRTGTEKPILHELEHTPKLNFVWFEITEDCNEKCVHCYGDFMPSAFKEKETEISKNKLSFAQWKQQIDNTYGLGCDTCQFIGGEPFLYSGEKRETVLDLAKYAKEKGFIFIEIFTNGTLLTPQKIKTLKELDINIAISLYSINPETHDQITKTPGSHKKTINALKMLKKAGIKTRVETVLMSINESEAEETQQFVESMGFDHKRLDVLRQNGRGGDFNLLPSRENLIKHGMMTSPNFSTSKDSLAKSLHGNSCLSGKITITDTGDVLPCVFSREQVLGNVLEEDLLEVIENEETRSVWRNTKDDVLVCQDCEYRYCCTDCRPQSYALSDNNGTYLTAPYSKCSYNPYTGKWGQGFWRLDTEGKSSYSEIVEGGGNN